MDGAKRRELKRLGKAEVERRSAEVKAALALSRLLRSPGFRRLHSINHAAVSGYLLGAYVVRAASSSDLASCGP